MSLLRRVPLPLLVACGTGAPTPSAVPTPTAPEGAPAAPATAPPDVVLLTLDTTRADHLGLYGYPRDTSPTLDALGQRALVFERLVVPMATTLPTHTSILTGTWPEEHGILANVIHGGRQFVPSAQLTSFAVHLQRHGYQTAAFVSAAPLKAGESGIGHGFDTFSEPERMERKGGATVDAALAWISAAPADRPMLLWVHLYDPHNPFTAPEEYTRRFQGDDLDAWLDARRPARTARRPSGEVVRLKAAVNGYDAELRYMDDQVARLLTALDARGRRDHTLLVVVGDHGEGLNQHGEPGHGLVWQEQLHAPLLMAAPGASPGRVDTLLSAADVLPTALGLVELPEEAAFLAQASGVDVLAPGFEIRPVLSQTSGRQSDLGTPLTFALTGERHKCTWQQEGASALYDLQADPFELTDIGPDQPAALTACTTELQAQLAAQRARGERLGAGGTAPMDAARVEALKALGYVEGDPE